MNVAMMLPPVGSLDAPVSYRPGERAPRPVARRQPTILAGACRRVRPVAGASVRAFTGVVTARRHRPI